MLRKFALALAAVTAVGVAALAPSAASAHGWHGGGWHGGGWHGGFHRGWGGPRFIVGGPVFAGGYGGCYVRRLVATPWGYRYRVVNRCY